MTAVRVKTRPSWQRRVVHTIIMVLTLVALYAVATYSDEHRLHLDGLIVVLGVINVMVWAYALRRKR